MVNTVPVRGAALVALMSLALAAQASTVPLDQPMSATISHSFSGGSPNEPNLISNDFGPAGKSTAFANLYATSSVLNGPVVSNSVTEYDWTPDTPGYVNGYLQANITSVLTYTFNVVGTSAVMVPVTLTGAIYLQATGDPNGNPYSSGQVALSISDNYPGSPHYTSGDAFNTQCDSVHTSGCNMPFELHAMMLAGTAATGLGNVAYVKMQAVSGTGTGYALGTSFATATIDPLVTIDAAFLAANPGFSLVFADGLTNAIAPVPELPIPVLLMAGLGLMFLKRPRN